MRLHKTAAGIGLLTFFTGAIGLFWKSNCAASGWGASVDTYRNLCYSDVSPLYYVRGFAAGGFPYLDAFEGRYLEYPVLTGIWMWLTAKIAEFTIHPATAFVYLTWITSLVLITITAMYLHKLESRKAIWFAFSPAVLLTLSINWDAAAVLSAILGIYLWRKGRLKEAGIAIGIGTAFKLFPALILVGFAVDAVKSRKLNKLIPTGIAAGSTWILVNAPIYFLNSEGWWEFYRFSQNRGIDFGSVWLSSNILLDTSFDTAFANHWASIGMVATILLVLLLSPKIDMYTAIFVVVGMFALLNKVYSPQFVLWLTPLAILSRISLRQFIIWQVAEAVYFVAIWRYLLRLTDASASGGIGEFGYGLAITVHLIATASLLGIALRNSITNRNPSGRL